MKKVMNLVIGGLQTKIFNLVLTTILLMVAAYTAVIVYQAKSLRLLSEETNEQQRSSIEAISGQTMNAVAVESLNRTAELEAAVADSTFRTVAKDVEIMADYAERLLSAPEEYHPKAVDFPDPAREGETRAQLMLDSGMSAEDPAVAAEATLLGNMSGLLCALYDSGDVNACYIATESGVFLLADNHPGGKFSENGELLTMPARSRPWYTQAAENGKLSFSDVQRDIFTDQIGVFCSCPVYVEGKLAAVVGADLFLDRMSANVENTSDTEKGFLCVINENGHVVFAPEKQALFQTRESGEAEDLRQAADSELAAFVTDALRGFTGTRIVHAGGEAYYMAGAPLDTVGWAMVTAVDQDSVAQPTAMLQEQYNAISDAARTSFRESSLKSLIGIVLLVLFVTVLTIGGALVLAKRIVKPLNTMTKRVASLGGHNLQFMMEDAYRTGDEIQVLAESFAELSEATIRYMGEVARVSAEKERIGAELKVATQIQADMLPRIFPPFPERRDFDIYASMQPAKEVGGDFYDFFLIDDDHLALVMADVSGKGVPAALFMVIAKTLIKNRALQGGGPAEILTAVNRQLSEGNEAGFFVTVWLSILELSTGKGLAANAGHEHPAIRRKGGAFELVKYPHSLAVATMDEIRFKEHEFELRPGDALFVYTDGVTEATNASEELFGEKRTVEALNRIPHAEARTLLETTQAAISEFVGDAMQFDDMTMLCLEYFGPEGKNADNA